MPPHGAIRSATRQEGRTIVDRLDPDLIKTRDELGAALTTLRNRAGLTVRELARRAALPAATADGYLRAKHLPGAGQSAQFQALLLGCGVTDEDTLARWHDALGRIRSDSDGRSAGLRARRRSDEPSPYRGLKAFEADDADLFFGRAAFVERLVTRVNEMGADDRLMFLIGASGSGKSSVLRAGLLPAMAASRSVAIMVPGRHPVAELESTLATAPEPRLLIVDQFEELYTLAGEQEAAAFVARLGALGPGTSIVAGLRADFFPGVAGDPALVPALQNWQMVMPPLSEPELRTAVVEPAAARGVTVDDALVDMVLAEIGHGSAAQPDALPLLSHALLSAWDHRTGGRLTVADYRAAGGLRGAVQQSAEFAYAELAPHHQELARRMFLRLVTVDEDVMTTKRRMDRTELPADDMAEVLEGFVARRLITVGERYVEISHDALLTAWPRLADWTAADHAGLLVHRRLTRAANDWQAGGTDDHLLLRGTPLAAAEEWAADPDHAAAMNAAERAFLAAGVAAREADARAARRRFNVLGGLAAALAVALVIAVLSAVHAVRTGDDAADQRQAAEQARDQALSREVAIEATRAATGDTALAQQLALAAYRISPTVDARSALLDTTAPGIVDRRVGAPGPTAMRLDPAGTVLAVSNAVTGEVVLYRYAGDRIGTRIGTVPSAHDQVFALAFTADGRTLAVGGSNGTVRLASAADPAHPTVLTGKAGGVEALAFSPDGHTLVAAGAAPTLRAWRGTAGSWVATPITGGGAQEVDQAVAFSPDGATLVAGGSTGVLHRWQSGRMNAAPSAVQLSHSMINMTVFTPDGSAVLAGAQDGSAEVIPAQGAARPLATGFTSWVNAGAYTPDGKQLAIGGSNGTIDTFDAQTGTRLGVITGTDKVTGLAYSPDGHVLLSAGADGTVRGYPAVTPAAASGPVFAISYDRTGDHLAAASGGAGGAITVSPSPGRVATPAWFGSPDGTTALSPDGRLIVAGSHGGQVLLTGTDPASVPPVALNGATSVIESLSFSPDGKTVAAASDDGFVQLWDVSDPGHPVTLPKLASGGEAASLAFSPDGRYLAAASVDRTVHLWNVADPRAAAPLATVGGFTNYAWSVAFSADSRLLVAGGADDTIRLWNLADPRHPALAAGPLTGPTHYVYSVAVSPDGRSLAAGGGDGSVWTWQLGKGEPAVMTALHAADPGGQVYAVAYQPSGATLAAAGSDGRVVFWTADPGTAAAALCHSGGDPLTKSEWSRYVPGAPYRPTCS